MKTFRNIIILFLATLLLLGVVYPLLIYTIGRAVPYQSSGMPVMVGDQLVGFENIGQPFAEPRYFWGRPSAVDYDASATGGSNLGPTNPDFLQTVSERIEQFSQAHPGAEASDIPVELVTASGSGLDPHITLEAALVQVPRVAQARNVSEETVRAAVDEATEGAFLGAFGPGPRVNVLKLNIALDKIR